MLSIATKKRPPKSWVGTGSITVTVPLKANTLYGYRRKKRYVTPPVRKKNCKSHTVTAVNIANQRAVSCHYVKVI